MAVSQNHATPDAMNHQYQNVAPCMPLITWAAAAYTLLNAYAVVKRISQGLWQSRSCTYLHRQTRSSQQFRIYST